MKVDKQQVERDQQERLRLGYIAKEGLESDFWREIVKPIIDSMIQGVIDIRDIKKALLSSNKKAEVLVEARAQTADYMSEIETLIKGYIIDAETVSAIQEKKEKVKPLYKEIE
jgi:hypothetical protein